MKLNKTVKVYIPAMALGWKKEIVVEVEASDHDEAFSRVGELLTKLVRALGPRKTHQA